MYELCSLHRCLYSGIVPSEEKHQMEPSHEITGAGKRCDSCYFIVNLKI